MSFHLPFRVFWTLTSQMNGFAVSQYQLEACDWLEETVDYPRRLLELPRGHLKSTLIGGHIVWQLLLNTNSTHMLVSGRQSLATENAKLIRDLILEHPLTGGINHPKWGRLPNLRGNEEGKQWTNEKFFVPRTRTIKDPSVRVVTMKNAVGKHAERIYADDLEIPATCSTAEERQKLRAGMNDFVSLCTNLDFLGTPHHQISIYPELEEQGYLTYKRAWEDENGNILWPDHPEVLKPYKDRPDYEVRKFSREWKDWQFDTGQTTEGYWNSQYQLLNVSSDSTIIPAELIHRYTGEVKSYEIRVGFDKPTVVNTYIEGKTSDGEEFKRKIVDWGTYWDTAYSQDTGDKAVFCIAYKDEHDNRYIHRLRVLPPVDEVDGYGPQADVIVDMCKEFDLPTATVEESGASTYAQEITRAANRAKVIVGPKPQRRDKKKSTFIHARIEPLARARRLYISEEAIRESEFFEELADCRLDRFGNFALGAHDDSLDSAAGALEELRQDSVKLNTQGKRLSPPTGGKLGTVKKGNAFSRRRAKHRR